MNAPENKQPDKPSDEPAPRPEEAPRDGTQGEQRQSVRAKNTAMGESKPKLKAGDIYSVVEKTDLVGPILVERIFEMLAQIEDPATILASLLRDFMDTVKPKVWGKLREHDVPAKLFEKLCTVIGVPDLGTAWNHMGREAAPEILGLLREYVPPSKEASDSFLRERSMLPLSILIYRAFRNDEAAMGRVIRDWLGPIAAGCEDQRQNVQKEAQRTAKWLIDLSSRRQNRGDFLAAVAPAMVSVRLGRAAFDDASAEALKRKRVESELQRTNDACGLLELKVAELTAALESKAAEVRIAEEKIKRLEETLDFSATRAADAAVQATGALKQKLKGQIIQRVEDARLFLDRPEPKISVALDLLEEIGQQFE